MGALELVNWWPVDSAAGGVARRDGRGLGSAGPDGVFAARVVDTVGAIERSFAWASLTKLLVALAVLVAVEEESISLDEPAGPPGSTVRHLLAHTSGLGPDSPVPVAAPARMRIYSNVGYEVLADTVARHLRVPFSDYLASAVLSKLHMASTSLAPGASPASGAQGSLRDLMALATELLAPTIVSPSTLTVATHVAFPGLRGVLPGYGRFDPCDWGLGFEVKGAKEPHWTGTVTSPATFGHFGRAGGFLWVDPATGLACATLSNRDFGPWAVTEWSTLADAVVAQWASAPVDEAPEAERREREAAEAARRHEAAEAERQLSKAAAAAEAAADLRRGVEQRVSSMAERREAVDVRVGDTQAGPEPESGTSEVGSLGPGIRPADFWGH